VADIGYLQATGANHLQRIFSGFPDGIRGVALLCLRSAAAILLVHDSVANWVGGFHLLVLITSGLSGLCLLIGFLTPAACLVAASLQIWEGAAHGWSTWPFSLLLVTVLVALAALGPGAFSVDGWLFGRKKITIGRQRS
jgi:hypothetical protein